MNAPLHKPNAWSINTKHAILNGLEPKNKSVYILNYLHAYAMKF